jgi:DegV family protein with EDD domain
MTIAVITDSSSQLSDSEIRDAGIAVVPLSIIIDGEQLIDGVDIDAATFYERIGEGVQLSTSQPSPGDFVSAWTIALELGATEILSVHVGDELSGTLNSARLAASSIGVPVHLIDSKTTSYGLGVVALEVARRARETSSTHGIVEFAQRLAAQISTVFILQDLRYILKGGRMRPANLPTGEKDVPVLGGSGGRYQLLGTGRSVDELVEQMATSLLAGEHRRHVAIAHAAPDTLVFTERLEAIMRDSDLVESVRRYRMGPAIAVHTGPGTAGGFAWPVSIDEPGGESE